VSRKVNRSSRRQQYQVLNLKSTEEKLAENKKLEAALKVVFTYKEKKEHQK